MASHCNPKCVYFPNHIYEKVEKNYKTDENGVKYNKTCAYCGYDDHLITKWEKCINYKEKYNVELESLTQNNGLNRDNKVIILLGKSAAGKDYILNHLVTKYNFNPIVSHTTRPKRKGEQEGKDYYFINNQIFSKMLHKEDFIETREYTTCFNNVKDIWYYGISKEEFDTKNRKICVVDTTGQKEILKYCDKNNVISIYIDTEDQIRESRAKIRGSFSQEEWNRRLKDDNKKFKKVKYDYILKNNGTKEEFEKNMENILKGEFLIG